MVVVDNALTAFMIDSYCPGLGDLLTTRVPEGNVERALMEAVHARKTRREIPGTFMLVSVCLTVESEEGVERE